MAVISPRKGLVSEVAAQSRKGWVAALLLIDLILFVAARTRFCFKGRNALTERYDAIGAPSNNSGTDYERNTVSDLDLAAFHFRPLECLRNPATRTSRRSVFR